MHRFRKRVFLSALVAALLGVWSASATAQAQPSVQVTLNVSEYDILFLTDLLNLKTQKLSSSVSGFSLNMAVTSPLSGSIDVCVYIDIQVQLRGDPRPEQLLSGYTNDFTIPAGSRTLTARDFAKDGSGVATLSRYTSPENTALKKRITDLAQTTSTAPAGIYRIAMRVLPRGAQNLSVVYGGDSKSIDIPYSSVDEVHVEIIDPKDGSFFNNLVPTFSWVTGAPKVTVRVYEVGLNHRSPQDAVTGGNPHLVKDLSGVTTMTYPQDANRLLQENKAYVLQVEAKVSTNRGELGNFSRPVVFRITDDRVGQMLDNFMKAMSDASSSTYTALRSEPSNWVAWFPNGSITLDGGILTENDLQILLNELAGRSDVNPELSIENQ